MDSAGTAFFTLRTIPHSLDCWSHMSPYRFVFDLPGRITRVGCRAAVTWRGQREELGRAAAPMTVSGAARGSGVRASKGNTPSDRRLFQYQLFIGKRRMFATCGPAPSTSLSDSSDRYNSFIPLLPSSFCGPAINRIKLNSKDLK